MVAAFDVVEHCEDDALAVSELARVLAPGGRMLLSVPAYQWAWSDHDVRAGHHRRYTRPRLERVVEGAGLSVARSTYAFGAVFPLFVAERARRRMQVRAGKEAASRLPSVSPRTDKVLMGLSGVDHRLLRKRDLPFGSSIFLAASSPRRTPLVLVPQLPRCRLAVREPAGGPRPLVVGVYPAALRSSASFSSRAPRPYRTSRGAPT